MRTIQGNMEAWGDDLPDYIAQDYGYEVDSNDGMTFDALEIIEVSRTVAMLNATEDRLYDNTIIPTANVIKEEDLRHRYYSEGYEANYEAADDKEILRWQAKFPHLRVVGGRGRDNESTTHSTSSNDRCALSNYLEFGVPTVQEQSFEIIGTKLTIPKITLPASHIADTSSEYLEEEVIAQDGILDDIIDIDTIKADDNIAMWDPAEVKKEEKMRRMIQEVWPEIVERLRPLIQKVVQVADENNIPKDLQELEALASSMHAINDNDDHDEW